MTMRVVILSGLLAALAIPTGSALAESERPGTVSVSGQGEVTAQPDMARVTLGVEARRPGLPDARTTVTAAVDRLLALTRELGIDAKYVNATGLQVQPDYTWNQEARKQELQGYVVSRQVQVELRDLDKLGTLMERAVSAGANQVGGATLDSTRRKELERQAMALAVQDARLNAETLARAAGAEIGAVRALNASSSPPQMPMYRMAAADMPAGAPPAETTYQAGDMTFTARVSVEYELVSK
ncbi:MAG: SIMPL domain-containing protein [Steroidobacteraceae bacterium]|nr:SIMPL domain-containing protein [Steroidobacteraceae bacterium]